MEFLLLSRRRNPLRETSPTAKNKEKRMFSQANMSMVRIKIRLNFYNFYNIFITGFLMK